MHPANNVSARRVVLAVVFLSVALVVTRIDAAKIGAGCQTLGVNKVTNGVTYKCRNLNGVLTWVTTAVTLSCARGGICKVGDQGPGGGIVFYVSARVINTVAGVSAGGHYLEAAPNTWNGRKSDPRREWGCQGTDISGANGTAVGTGAQNTKDIDAGCITDGIAADIAINLTFRGQSDWFLPSQDELTLMCKYFTTIVGRWCGGSKTPSGGFTTGLYWSSFENDANGAWYEVFGPSYKGTDSKDFRLYVRPIRAFG